MLDTLRQKYLQYLEAHKDKRNLPIGTVVSATEDIFGSDTFKNIVIIPKGTRGKICNILDDDTELIPYEVLWDNEAASEVSYSDIQIIQ